MAEFWNLTAAFTVVGLRSAPIPADASQAPAELLGDEDVDALAGYACMSWPSVALAAACAAAARQPSPGDHPQVLGEPDVGDPDLVIVFHGDAYSPRASGTSPIVVHSHPRSEGRFTSRLVTRSPRGRKPAW